MNRYVAKSLKLQLLVMVLVSLLIAVAVFFISFFLGNMLLDKTIYGQTFAEKMADRQFSNLQAYVEDESVSLSNLQRLNAWCSRGEKVYLTLYQNDVLVYESFFTEGQTGNTDLWEYYPEMEDSNNEYLLVLNGDVPVRAFLYYYAGDIFYFVLMLISAILAFVAFSLCFITLINRKLTYISLLKRELDILSGGQLEYEVTIRGCDELGELALGIDRMRCSIVNHQRVENQMRTANSELITAMSHDLRTPLTSLLVYLEILDQKKYMDESQMELLIRKSMGQTLRIKQMADKLFEYFFAYATEWECLETEKIDANELCCQMLDDYAYSLESRGFVIKKEYSQIFGTVSVNLELFQRVIDNLYSNLLKYADLKDPVRFGYEKNQDLLHLYIKNNVLLDQEKNKSTSIGLLTCRRIIEYHNGSFDVTEENGIFGIHIYIPLHD